MGIAVKTCRFLLVALMVLSVVLLAGCGGSESPSQTTTTQPSPEPTGALTPEEARYVADLRDDASLALDGLDSIEAVLNEYPDVTPSTQSDIETQVDTLDALAEDWQSSELPSQRVSAAEDYWLRSLEHIRKAVELGAQGAVDGNLEVNKITAQVSLGIKDIDRLTGEVDGLDAL